MDNKKQKMEEQEMIGKTVDVNERLPLLQSIPLSLQHLFAMFGATVLVPFLVGLDPSVTLFSSGVGTLIYILITKGKIPAYLGSSFAFLTALSAIIGPKDANNLGNPAHISIAMGACIVVGIIYIIVSLFIWKFGTRWLDVILPPAVIGPVVMVIGLALANTAIGMASSNYGIALVSLVIAVLAAVLFGGFLGVIPILIGIIGGYIYALILGQVHFEHFNQVKEIAAIPHFILPHFSWPVILMFAPISLVVITEHIGHLIVTNNVVGRDFIKDPGLHRSLAGDGFATAFAGLIGGPPNTTYGENIGVMAITRVFSVWVIGGAAIFAIIMSFIPKVGALIQTIPASVMGGICIMLFGIIASAGIRMLVEAKTDFSLKSNLIVSSVILIVGVGGTKLKFGGGFELGDMALATIIGIVLNLLINHLIPWLKRVMGVSENVVVTKH